NTRLFDRSQGRIALTAAGTLALEYAERILALSSELDTRMKESSGQLAGPLLLGASMTIGEYVLPQLIGKFKASFPAVVPTLFVGTPEALKGLVATGLGFAIMSRVIVAKELQLGQLVQVPLRPPLMRNFSVVYPKERFHSRLVAGFLQFAKERLTAELRLAA